jgi:hypothetical protein
MYVHITYLHTYVYTYINSCIHKFIHTPTHTHTQGAIYGLYVDDDDVFGGLLTVTIVVELGVVSLHGLGPWQRSPAARASFDDNILDNVGLQVRGRQVKYVCVCVCVFVCVCHYHYHYYFSPPSAGETGGHGARDSSL